MSEFEHKEKEHITRQKAAERLTDIAYGLSTGGSFEFVINGQRLTVPIGDGVELRRDLAVTDDHVELALELRWPTAHVARFVAPAEPEHSGSPGL